jgi:rod shape-determining protein MreC
VATPRRPRRPRSTLLILVLVSLALVTLDARSGFGRITSGAKSVASDAFAPVRSGVDGIVEPIGHFLAGSVHYGAVVQQNQKLRQEYAQAKEAGLGQSATARRLAQLSNQLDLPFIGNLQSLPAQVINYDSSDFAATIDIDRGRSDGVQVGMPVVEGLGGNKGGLVGQVVEAGHHTATVRLITDGLSVVGAQYGASPTSSGGNAILDGNGWGKALSADQVHVDTKLAVGEVFSTSGLQGATFPPLIPVARVTSSKSDTSSTQETVTLQPVVDLANLSYVSVVLWGPPS